MKPLPVTDPEETRDDEGVQCSPEDQSGRGSSCCTGDERALDGCTKLDDGGADSGGVPEGGRIMLGTDMNRVAAIEGGRCSSRLGKRGPTAVGTSGEGSHETTRSNRRGGDVE